MSVSIVKIIQTKYRLHKITAVDVWQYVDDGTITEAQAVLICGPRPADEGGI